MNDELKERIYIGFFAFLLVMGVIGWAKYFDAEKASKDWHTNYSDAIDELRVIKNEWGNCRRTRDYYKTKLDALPVCRNHLSRIEYLEGQLESCTNAYTAESWEWISSPDSLRSAPCHQHPDGISCGWEPCNMLYDCAFGELGWIGPDRLMCDEFGNTRYNEARAVCYSDRNCSSCLEMTKGDLGHCYAFAYYPR